MGTKHREGKEIFAGWKGWENEEKQVICIGNGGGSGGYVDDRLRKQKFTD